MNAKYFVMRKLFCVVALVISATSAPAQVVGFSGIAGRWVGTLTQEGVANPYELELTLQQDYNSSSSNPRFTGKALLKTATGGAKLSTEVSGWQNKNSILLLDWTITDGTADIEWCKKFYSGKLINLSGEEVISGSWHATGKKVFINGQMKTARLGMLPPGSFLLRRDTREGLGSAAKPARINASGNTGFGVGSAPVSSTPPVNESRIILADNLAVNTSNAYPNGYQPTWDIVNHFTELEFRQSDYTSLAKYSNPTYNMDVSITKFNGRAAVMFYPPCNTRCQCVADIVTPLGSVATLDNREQTFTLANFREPGSGDPCVAWKVYDGTISLRCANSNDDIAVSLAINQYKFDHWARNNRGDLQTSWASQNFISANKTPAAAANKVVQAKGGQKRVDAELAESQQLRPQIDNLVKEMSHGWYVWKYVPGSVTDVKILESSASGKAARVRANFSYYVTTDLRQTWVEVLFDEGLAYYMREGTEETNYIQPNASGLSASQQVQMKSAQERFNAGLNKVYATNTTASYQRVLNTLRAYNAAFDVKNYLAPATYYVNERRTRTVTDYDDRTTNQGTTISVPYQKDEYYYESVPVQGLKNTADHPIIIKGIHKGNGIKGGVGYDDISIRVEPGQTIEFRSISEYYDEKSAPVPSDRYFKKVR